MTRPTPESTDPTSRPDTGHTPEPALGPVPGQLNPGPPTKHQLALMIWLAVFPTLTILNLVLGDWLRTLNAVTRTFVLATIAVPIVIDILMPQLHRLRRQLLSRIAAWS
jgi:antibiotic biosynthesis monooxygenase (ABM) superfamily enzyme